MVEVVKANPDIETLKIIMYVAVNIMVTGVRVVRFIPVF